MKPPRSISSKAAAKGPDQGPPSLGKTRRVRRKHSIYWAGFLEGAISSGRITKTEEAAIEAEARAFMEFFDCADAADLIQDINAQCFSSENDMLTGLNDIIDEITLPPADPMVNQQSHDEINRFMGLCAGIICDGFVTLLEAQALLRAYERAEYLVDSPIFDELGGLLFDALYDDALSADEASDLQEALVNLVGDAFSDTGVAAIGLVSKPYNPITRTSGITLQGQSFVITGALSIGPRAEILRAIEAAGGIAQKYISRQTNYLVVSETASRAWAGTHFGRKIEKALLYNEEGCSIQFVPEHVLAEILDI